jgi:hypothetical protein
MEGTALKPDTTQTPLRVTTHPLYLIDLAGDQPMLACPECRTWLVVTDGMLPPHRSDHKPDQARRDKAAPRRPRCGASRQGGAAPAAMRSVAPAGSAGPVAEHLGEPVRRRRARRRDAPRKPGVR